MATTALYRNIKSMIIKKMGNVRRYVFEDKNCNTT